MRPGRPGGRDGRTLAEIASSRGVAPERLVIDLLLETGGSYAIRDGIVTVREAIDRLSFRPARRVGLKDRGAIAPGQRADLVTFDPDRVIDRATYEEPELPPSGIDWVIVGGAVAVDADGPTGARCGGVARMNDPRI